jgi:hypothetical protein
MCSEHLVVISNLLMFQVMDLHKYFQSVTKFIGPATVAVNSHFVDLVVFTS